MYFQFFLPSLVLLLYVLLTHVFKLYIASLKNVYSQLYCKEVQAQKKASPSVLFTALCRPRLSSVVFYSFYRTYFNILCTVDMLVKKYLRFCLSIVVFNFTVTFWRIFALHVEYKVDKCFPFSNLRMSFHLLWFTLFLMRN